MNIQIFKTSEELGAKAAAEAAVILKKVISEKGKATIVVATGASQFNMLKNLTTDTSIDWSKVTMFHLDEYIGLPDTHPASFRKYLKERFINPVKNLKEVNLINGDAPDAAAECKRLGDKISKHEIDILFCGFGENSHLAFNDPPADFTTTEPYIVVDLDEACRKQQMGEGWFPTINDVPAKAISMSINQIMKAKHMICCVPDKRKADAVKHCIDGEITNKYPASILQKHADCRYYFDTDSASLLNRKG